MKNYLKLHRLAFRRKVAGRANLVAAEELRGFEADLRELQKKRDELATTAYMRRDERDTALEKMEAAIERAIAVRDVVAEERQKVEATFSAAASSYNSVLAYLEDNRHLIPEGIPHGI